MAGRPVIAPLTQHECIALLQRNVVGRLAFLRDGRPDVQPLHYWFEAGWILGRTSPGAKLAALAHDAWVAFEVDEVVGPFEWASVVVRGTFHRLDPAAREADLGPATHAIARLRTVVPGTFEADDPAPHRTVPFRISVGEMTGRRATATRTAPPATEHEAD